MKSQNMGLICPLNITPAEYEASFEKDPPSELGLAISLFEIEKVPADIRDALWFRLGAAMGTMNKLVREFPEVERQLKLTGTKKLEFSALPKLPDTTFPTKLTSEQKEWIVYGMYLGAAFCKPDALGQEEIHVSTNVGMMYLDRWISESGSIEPKHHSSLSVSQREAFNHINSVGDAFRSDYGIWTRELVNLRNQWLIMLRALMEWKDPFDEYNRFVKAGGSYFLDYPRLCLHSTSPAVKAQASWKSAMPRSVRDLLHPFNLPKAEYEKMYAENPPEDLQLTCVLLHDPNLGHEKTKQQLQKPIEVLAGVLDALPKEAQRFGLSSTIDTNLDYVPCPRFLWYLLDSRQRQWIHGGIYVQVGFINPSLIAEYYADRDIAAAMTLLDYVNNRAKSGDPSKHEPLMIPAKNARDFRSSVGSLYKERIGVWCKQLEEYRDKAMVMCRAALAGKNPTAEYQHYVMSRSRDFMDYHPPIP